MKQGEAENAPYSSKFKESGLERVLFGELNLRKAAQTYKLAVITIRQHVLRPKRTQEDSWFHLKRSKTLYALASGLL